MASHSSILVQKIPWQWNLAGYNPWVTKELDTTQQLNKKSTCTQLEGIRERLTRLHEVGLSHVRDSPGKNTRMGCHALLQGIFPTQGSKPVSRLVHWQAGSLPLAPPEKSTGQYGNSIFSFLRSQTVPNFSQWLHHFTFQPADSSHPFQQLLFSFILLQ